MEKIEIKNFKAFKSRIALIPTINRKNLLIYGENGSGKSSIYEALRLVFYHKRLLQPFVSRGASAEVRQAEEESFFRSFNNRKPTGEPLVNFNITYNGNDFKSFNSSTYQCFMLSYADLHYEQHKIADGKIAEIDVINLKELLSQVFFPDFSIDDFLTHKSATLISNVNNVLRNKFAEDYCINIENEAYDVRIEQHHIRESNGLHKIFNEAKINLALILIFLESVKLLASSPEDGKRKLLVIDDLITSLDACNRLYFANYLLTDFNTFQKIFLTHNVGYNNMIAMRIKEHGVSGLWNLYNLYITESGPQIYSYDEIKSATDIRQEFDNGTLSPAQTGVEIRKRFEADVNEVAKMFQLDATSRAMDVIGDIISGQNKFYYCKQNGKIRDANNLVESIETLVSSASSDSDKVSNIQSELSKYHSDEDVKNLVDFIKEFHFYERLFIHSLAHGTAPMPTFIQKEVYAATHLLERMENLIKGIKDTVTTP